MEQSYITIEIPKNYITPESNLSLIVPEEVLAIPTERKQYQLKEVLSMKGSITKDIAELKRHVHKTKMSDIDMLNAELLRLDAMEFNLNIVKCTLALANTPINPTIMDKSRLEAKSVFLSRILNENLKNKGSNYESSSIKSSLAEVNKKISLCKKTLEKYNSLVKATVTLYNI